MNPDVPNVVSSVIARRYLLQERLGAGGMGVVYRAFDRLTGQIVALKQVTTPGQHLQFASISDSIDFRLALAHEFKTLASLRHPNIISVLDYGFDAERQPFFTMDLLENGQPLHEAGRVKDFDGKLTLLMQLLQALVYLHRRGILHRDLKPANVLVVGDGSDAAAVGSAISSTVRVLDFGLADTRGGQGTSGTLAYMAPEILMGEPSTEASDLYAVGMMAYELFAGKHPFHVDNPGLLLNEIVSVEPDVSALNIDPQAEQVIRRLLAKEPGARYSDAGQVIADLSHLTEQPIPTETAATRESFLQAAQFVGRDVEISALTNALSAAMRGTGSAWLVGGESGSGKSRLLDELRTQSLVEGALVLRGQSIREGSASYQPWRDVLRYLCLETDLSDLDASVLKSLVPDIGELIEREVEDASDLDAQATQVRLLNVVESVIARQEQPLVIILEDLHWATSETFLLLKRAVRLSPDRPLLLIGSYRDEEMPDLPSELPDMQTLRLARLPKENIAELSESMLGVAGRQPNIVELLQRETEGNVFFIVEVVRTLAEEAGQLEDIGKKTLPAKVFAGGMNAVIHERLRRVPEADRPLLRFAAVAGRQLDLDLLKAIQPDLTAWLTSSANVAVLDVSEDRWRFAHDKLRDAILDEIAPADQKALHGQVAQTIERVYPDSEEQTPALAYHWSEAGDLKKAALYTARAGELSMEHGALQEAVILLERAQDLQQQIDAPVLERARVQRLLVRALVGVGRIADGIPHLELAWTLLGYPLPENRVIFTAKLVQLALIQGAHLFWPVLIRKRNFDPVHLNEMVSLADANEAYLWTGVHKNMIYRGLTLANVLDQTDMGVQRVMFSTVAAYGTSLIPIHAASRRLQRRAEEALATVDDPMAHAQSARVRSLLHIHRGEWPQATAAIDRSLNLFRQLGNETQVMFNVLQHAAVAYYTGDWAEVLRRMDELDQLARHNTNVQYMAWAACIRGVILMHRGQLAEAADLFTQAVPYIEQTRDVMFDIQVHGQLALIQLYKGQTANLEPKVDAIAYRIAHTPATGHAMMGGYAAPVEVYMALWQESAAAGRYQAKVRQSLKEMRTFGRKFDIARPRWLLWQGQYEFMLGKKDSAQKLWQQSASEAHKHRMPYEEALPLYFMGCALPTVDPQRDQYLSRAADILRHLDATFDLDRVEAERKKTTGA